MKKSMIKKIFFVLLISLPNLLVALYFILPFQMSNKGRIGIFLVILVLLFHISMIPVYKKIDIR